MTPPLEIESRRAVAARAGPCAGFGSGWADVPRTSPFSARCGAQRATDAGIGAVREQVTPAAGVAVPVQAAA